MAIKLGEMLVKTGLISADQLQEALGAQKQSGERRAVGIAELPGLGAGICGEDFIARRDDGGADWLEDLD